MANSFVLARSVVSSSVEERGPGVFMSVDARTGADQHRVEDLFRAIIRRLETGDLDALEGWVDVQVAREGLTPQEEERIRLLATEAADEVMHRFEKLLAEQPSEGSAS